MSPRIVNVFRDELPVQRDRPGWELRSLRVAAELGSELLGASLYELAAGSKTFPYHVHYGEEEILLVLEGRPTVRTPEGERELKPGEAVLFPLGPHPCVHALLILLRQVEAPDAHINDLDAVLAQRRAIGE